MPTLEELPVEVLASLLSYLPGRDLGRVSQSCSKLREAVNIDSVWRQRCKAEFGINQISSKRGVTFYELYSKILYRYGKTLGVWQPDVGPYGGLILVQFTGDRLDGVQCHPPTNPHVTRPLRMRRVFSVELDDARQTSVLCHSRHGDPHSTDIRQLEMIEQEKDVFSCKCSSPEHHRHPQGKEAEFAEWLSLETDNDLQNFLFHGQELLLMKFLITSQFETSSSLTRLHLPTADPSVFEVIPPGVFKGSYGSHGVEMLSVSYDEDHANISVTKITGDPNVPAGQVSIMVDLSRPMILNNLQQGSIQLLSEIDTPDVPEDMTLDRLPRQPFRVPPDCLDRDIDPAPSTCRARFHSRGQIAGQGFSDPAFIPGHFIIFDHNTFGHIWLQLASFSIYSRVEEDLTQTVVINQTPPNPDS